MTVKLRFWTGIILYFILNYLLVSTTAAQSPIENKYGLLVIDHIGSFKKTIDGDSTKRLVDIGNCLPGIILDLKYATTGNFMRRQLYPSLHTTYLRKAAAECLRKVLTELENLNLTIKIFDAYRPYSVTEEMWEAVKDDRYAADPAKGSGHNRGVAVDLTLAKMVTGKELPMGTGYDNFSDTAHTDFRFLPAAILKNREVLKSIMEKYGFISLDTEWWHFSLPNASSFELLNLDFDELESMSEKCN